MCKNSEIMSSGSHGCWTNPWMFTVWLAPQYGEPCFVVTMMIRHRIIIYMFSLQASKSEGYVDPDKITGVPLQLQWTLWIMIWMRPYLHPLQATERSAECTSQDSRIVTMTPQSSTGITAVCRHYTSPKHWRSHSMLPRQRSA